MNCNQLALFDEVPAPATHADAEAPRGWLVRYHIVTPVCHITTPDVEYYNAYTGKHHAWCRKWVERYPRPAWYESK
jgi:hypothetical protein